MQNDVEKGECVPPEGPHPPHVAPAPLLGLAGCGITFLLTVLGAVGGGLIGMAGELLGC